MPINRIKELISLITAADTAYYKNDNPTMSDREYDELYDELLALEEHTGIQLAGSPTMNVPGAILESLNSVKHSRPMLSAKKTKSEDDIIKFVDGKAAVVSWKLDGLTLVLRYEDGHLIQALTRGENGEGEDVTHSVRVMENVPVRVPCKDSFEVRGEGVISWANFQRTNEHLLPGEEPYAHPRNLAAGSVRRLDARKTKENRIEFFAFDLNNDKMVDHSKMLHHRFLEYNGFDIVDYQIITQNSSGNKIKEKLRKFEPHNFDYPVDGLIVEYDDIAYGKSLGATGHHENRLIALKWEDKLYETTFLGLELAVTRTGMVSLTGMFEDVVIEGTTVNRAYLHNLDYLDKFELGIGDRVKIYKANMIIPQLAGNITKSGTLSYPDKCPSCGSELIIRKTNNGTRMLFCENSNCSAKPARKFAHYCSKTRMNIEGLSEPKLQKLIDAGYLKNLGDLYLLHKHQESIANLPGFGCTSVQNILNAIEKSRKCTLNQFIAGLGIHIVGRTAGRVLREHFNGDWQAFEQAIQDEYDFTQLDDFGETMHNSIYQWYYDKAEELFWRHALKYIEFIIEEKSEPNKSSLFSGKIIVVTGTLENHTRESIEAEIETLGGISKRSVSNKTDYVIYGQNAGSKLNKANELGIKTLSEAEFEALKNRGE